MSSSEHYVMSVDIKKVVKIAPTLVGRGSDRDISAKEVREVEDLIHVVVKGDTFDGTVAKARRMLDAATEEESGE